MFLLLGMMKLMLPTVICSPKYMNIAGKIIGSQQESLSDIFICHLLRNIPSSLHFLPTFPSQPSESSYQLLYLQGLGGGQIVSFLLYACSAAYLSLWEYT